MAAADRILSAFLGAGVLSITILRSEHRRSLKPLCQLRDSQTARLTVHGQGHGCSFSLELETRKFSGGARDLNLGYFFFRHAQFFRSKQMACKKQGEHKLSSEKDLCKPAVWPLLGKFFSLSRGKQCCFC